MTQPFSTGVANFFPGAAPDSQSYIDRNSGPNFVPGDGGDTNWPPLEQNITALRIAADRNAGRETEPEESVDAADENEPDEPGAESVSTDRFVDEKTLNPNRPRSRRQGGQ